MTDSYWRSSTLSLFLDIDRTRSVFRLLFLCCLDEACADPVPMQFDEALREITLGAQVPSTAMEKLRGIHSEILSNPTSIAHEARRVAAEFAEQRDTVITVFRIVLRIANDEGMLSRRDCTRVRDIALSFDFAMAELEQLSVTERVIFDSCFNSKQEANLLEGLEQHFETLGCTPDMSRAEIKNRYRTLAKQYHPDTSSARNDARQCREQFVKMQEAYSAIKELL